MIATKVVDVVVVVAAHRSARPAYSAAITCSMLPHTTSSHEHVKKTDVALFRKSPAQSTELLGWNEEVHVLNRKMRSSYARQGLTLASVLLREIAVVRARLL